MTVEVSGPVVMPRLLSGGGPSIGKHCNNDGDNCVVKSGTPTYVEKSVWEMVSSDMPSVAVVETGLSLIYAVTVRPCEKVKWLIIVSTLTSGLCICE